MDALNALPVLVATMDSQINLTKKRLLIGSALLAISGVGVVFFGLYATVDFTAKVIVTTGVILVISSLIPAAIRFRINSPIDEAKKLIEEFQDTLKEEKEISESESEDEVETDSEEEGRGEKETTKENPPRPIQEKLPDNAAPPMSLETRSDVASEDKLEKEEEKGKEIEAKGEPSSFEFGDFSTSASYSTGPCKVVPRGLKRTFSKIDSTITEHFDTVPNFYETSYRDFRKSLVHFFETSFSAFFELILGKRRDLLEKLGDRPALSITFVGGGLIGMIAALEAYQKGASIHYFMTERKENPLFRFDKMRGELLEKNFSPLLDLAKTHHMASLSDQGLVAEGEALEEMFASLLLAIAKKDDQVKVYPASEEITFEGKEVITKGGRFQTDWVVSACKTLPTPVFEWVGKRKSMLEETQIITTATFPNPWGNHPEHSLLDKFPSEVMLQGHLGAALMENKGQSPKKLSRKSLWQMKPEPYAVALKKAEAKQEKSLEELSEPALLAKEGLKGVFGTLDSVKGSLVMPTLPKEVTLTVSPFRVILDFEWPGGLFHDPTTMREELKEPQKRRWIETCLSMYFPNEVIEIMKIQEIQHETHKFYPVAQAETIVQEKDGLKLFLIGKSATLLSPLGHNDSHSLQDAFGLGGLVFIWAFNPDKMKEAQEKYESGIRSRAQSMVKYYTKRDKDRSGDRVMTNGFQTAFAYSPRAHEGKVKGKGKEK